VITPGRLRAFSDATGSILSVGLTIERLRVRFLATRLSRNKAAQAIRIH